MSSETVTFIILGLAMVLLVSELLQPDLVALLVVISLGLTGVLTVSEAFSGFSRSAVIIIMAVFILAEGLQRTGVTERIGTYLVRISRAQESWLVLIVTLSGAFLSLFMNNIAAASVLFPAVSGAAHKSKISSSRVLMPLAFGTILGGMATLFTSSNIIASSLLKDQGLNGFGVLDFAPLGLPLVIIGITYMAVWGQRLLPKKSPVQLMHESYAKEGDLSIVYRLSERLLEASVPYDSPLVGVSLGESKLRETYNLNLMAIKREAKIISPSPDFRFEKDDLLLLEGRPEEITPGLLQPALTLMPVGDWAGRELESQETTLVEAVLSPRSSLIGQTLRSARFREKYDMNVIAIWRAGKPIRTRLTDLPLQFGDALLLQGFRDRVNVLLYEPDLIVLDFRKQETATIPGKAWLSILIMATTLLAAAAFPSLVGEAMLGGAIAMVLVGILTMDQVYRAIDWKSIFLIAGMLPLGVAMTKSGAASTMTNGLSSLIGQTGPIAMLACLVIITILLSQVINGAAVVSILTPIAIGISRSIGANPRAMVMGVALAASITFMTPLGHAVNVLVMGPGGYRFRNYMVVGFPLTLLLFIAIMILLPIIWPLT
jgi:di/tricarboxylate transporter